jgi:hypothetical protein
MSELSCKTTGSVPDRGVGVKGRTAQGVISSSRMEHTSQAKGMQIPPCLMGKQQKRSQEGIALEGIREVVCGLPSLVL